MGRSVAPRKALRSVGPSDNEFTFGCSKKGVEIQSQIESDDEEEQPEATDREVLSSSSARRKDVPSQADIDDDEEEFEEGDTRALLRCPAFSQKKGFDESATQQDEDKDIEISLSRGAREAMYKSPPNVGVSRGERQELERKKGTNVRKLAHPSSQTQTKRSRKNNELIHAKELPGGVHSFNRSTKEQSFRKRKQFNRNQHSHKVLRGKNATATRGNISGTLEQNSCAPSPQASPL